MKINLVAFIQKSLKLLFTMSETAPKIEVSTLSDHTPLLACFSNIIESNGDWIEWWWNQTYYQYLQWAISLGHTMVHVVENINLIHISGALMRFPHDRFMGICCRPPGKIIFMFSNGHICTTGHKDNSIYKHILLKSAIIK